MLRRNLPLPPATAVIPKLPSLRSSPITNDSIDVEKLVLVPTILAPIQVDHGNIFCDLSMICSDGVVKAERSQICRQSEVFFRMLTSGYKESKPIVEGNTVSWKIDLPSEQASVVRKVCELIENPTFDFSTYSQEKEEFNQFIRFLHRYDFAFQLYSLKLWLITQDPTNEYLSLDLELSLGIRKYFLKSLLQRLKMGEILTIYDEPEIYVEIFECVFPLMQVYDSSREAWTNLQLLFLKSFRLSNHDGKIFCKYIGRNDHVGDSIIWTGLLETVTDPALRSEKLTLLVYMATRPGHHKEVAEFRKGRMDELRKRKIREESEEDENVF